MVVVLLLCAAGGTLLGQPRREEATREELRRENAALRALLSFQGRWKHTGEDTRLIIEGERWWWVGGKDDTIAATGKIKVVNVGPEHARVELIHRTGAGKGKTSKVIMHVRGEDTLRYHASFDEFPKGFREGAIVWKKIPR
jgi:hypothetical protein